ncbi:MAG: hypothetical protein C4325_00495 [Blastocatellia bacterium]
MKIRNVTIGLAGTIAAAIAVKMLTRSATVRWKDAAEELPHSDKSKFVSVDGIRLHYQEFCSPPTVADVILIHGFTASVYAWRSVAPMLAAAGLRVIALDLPGFGYSERPRIFDYSIASQSRIVERFMNRLGIGAPALVGSSYGGAVAAMLALDYPERVGKLILVSPVTNDNPKRRLVMRLAAVPGIGEIITPFLADSISFHRRQMEKALAPANHRLITSDRLEAIRRPLAAADAHNSLLATARNWSAERIEQDAELLNQPTLIIWGEDDRIIPIENGYRLHNKLLRSRMVVIRDCGHVPMEEKPEVFVSVVLDFCKDRFTPKEDENLPITR